MNNLTLMRLVDRNNLKQVGLISVRNFLRGNNEPMILEASEVPSGNLRQKYGRLETLLSITLSSSLPASDR
jgi:hypothetical protein